MILDWSDIDRKLISDGYVILNLEVDSPQSLQCTLDELPVEWGYYDFGQSIRRHLTEFVYTASEYPPDKSIPTHHELSYTTCPPRWIVFYAHHPSANGSIKLLDGELVVKELRKDSLWGPLLFKSIQYKKHMRNQGELGWGKSWQEHFERSDKMYVEDQLRSLGVEFRWTSDGLETICTRPLLRWHPGRKKDVWFAQPRLWELDYRGRSGAFLKQRLPKERLPIQVCWENGTPICMELLKRIDELEIEFAQTHYLERGQLLIIDNWRFAHGREPYEGTREHWVAMGT